jgi:uridine phosphorylase
LAIAQLYSQPILPILRPHESVAERVVLPGDPGRALRLAQQLLDKPKMAADGLPLTIQSTGLGGPSTALVVEDLIALGARRLVRAGTCTAFVDAQLIIPDAVLPHDGASRALGADGPLAPDPVLFAALRAAGNGAVVGPVVSADVMGGEWPDAVALDLSTAAVFAVAARHGVPAACVLARDEDGEAELGRVAASSCA